ncbi:unnamed protein product [Somion occarium]|uniref:Amidohydrolase 3 domain-containing protein n=1 Tax=Somion occarium TaxID=3059160 RepID=A0ABP1DJV1_9APHY
MSAQSTPSELRKRSPSSSPSGRSQKDRSLDSTRQLKPSYRPNNALRMTAIRVVVAGLLGFFGLRAAQKWGRSEVPDAYALCSPEGKIFTVDEANPEVECMVIHGSHFSDVGSLADIRLRWTAIPVRFIQSGAVVVPGISDSHVHILEYGATIQLPLEGPKSVKETVQVVRNYILSDPDVRHNKSTFVEGWGWDHTQWLLEQWPTSEDLENDPVVRGRPIVLQSKDGHAIWVSKKILDDIEFIPEEIEGGTIFRDSNGNPTGVFMDSAQSLVNAPEPTHDQMEKRFGLAVRDALSARSVKIFADGALRSGGAALYEPYSDNPETRGFLRIDPELLNKVIPRFLRDGWQVNVHAIGDRANGVVLDAFEAALKDANVSALRPRLEHAQILAKKDMARFGDLGIIASIQPTHAISDMWFGEDRLGPERVKGLYAFRSIIDHGGRIALGSDFPVEDMNPLAGFYAAITRLSPDGKSPHGPGGWFPEQRMTRQEALKGMTLDPAYASFSDDQLGTITPGKRADYVVLSKDIMTIPAGKLLETKVLATVIDGRPVYGKI